MHTAIKEIWHIMQQEDEPGKEPKSINRIIFSVVIMNPVFSFDALSSTIALTDVFLVTAIAIVIGGVLMIWLSGSVTTFLQKNRMYVVPGLFILLVVGIMLLSEGGHLAHLKLFENPVTPIGKTTYYFAIAVLIIIDVIKSRYQKKLLKQKA
jgi:predicted tellurium resistance membrane protein TerC